MITYQNLVNSLNKIMPEKYKSGIVNNCYYTRPFSPYELNFNPYKNYGEILPTEYIFRDASNPNITYKMSKGEQYIPMMLYWIVYHKDFKCLAPFFIYSFFKDLDGYFKESPNIIPSVLIENSIDYLKDNGYKPVDYRCKRILPIYNDTFIEIDELLTGKEYIDSDQLARDIFSVFSILLSPYELEYWQFQESEYERAHKIYRDAVNDSFNDLMNMAEETFGDSKKSKLERIDFYD